MQINKRAGCCDEERDNFTAVLDSGFVDVYRHFHPEDVTNHYTFFPYLFNSKAKNKGFRFDYFVATKDVLPAIHRIKVEREQNGSDHVPLLLEIDENLLIQPESVCFQKMYINL